MGRRKFSIVVFVFPRGDVLNSLLSMRRAEDFSLRFRSVLLMRSSSASIETQMAKLLADDGEVRYFCCNPSILLSCKCLVKFNTSFWALILVPSSLDSPDDTTQVAKLTAADGAAVGISVAISKARAHATPRHSPPTIVDENNRDTFR